MTTQRRAVVCCAELVCVGIFLFILMRPREQRNAIVVRPAMSPVATLSNDALGLKITDQGSRLPQTKIVSQQRDFVPARTGIGVPIQMRNIVDSKDAGFDSAQAALQSMQWAIAGGDVERIEKLLFLPAQSRLRLTELLESFAEPERAKYGTPERLAALLVAAQKPVQRYLVSQDVELDTGMRKLVMRTPDGTGKLGATSQEFRYSEGSGWQRVITLQQVMRWSDILKSDLYRAATNQGR